MKILFDISEWIRDLESEFNRVFGWFFTNGHKAEH